MKYLSFLGKSASVIELPFGSVSPNKRIEKHIKDKKIKNPPTWVKSETIDPATKGQIFALPSNAKRYDINLEDTYEVGPPTAGMVFMYAKENDITVEVTLEGSLANLTIQADHDQVASPENLVEEVVLEPLSTQCREEVHSFKMDIQVEGTRRSKLQLRWRWRWRTKRGRWWRTNHLLSWW